MRALALALGAAALGLLFVGSSVEQSFAGELQRWTPDAPRALLELGDRLTDELDRDAWRVFRSGLERAPTLPLRPTAREAVLGWLTVVASLGTASPEGSPRRARVEFWRRLLPGFGL